MRMRKVYPTATSCRFDYRCPRTVGSGNDTGRPQSDWQRSQAVLQAAVKWGLLTKTGMMVGLGETDEEVLEVLAEMAALGVQIFNIGQYLQPTRNHLPVQRFIHPDVFKFYKEKGLEMGFEVVESGPLVRSSYHADEQARMAMVTAVG